MHPTQSCRSFNSAFKSVSDTNGKRAIHRFRRISTLQKFTSVHITSQNHFNHERHLIDRNTYKTRRSAGMVE